MPLPFIRTGRTSSCGTAILAVVTQNRAPSAKVLASGQPPRVWRPQLWVRVIAGVVAVLMGLGLMFPQVLNPSWVTGTPASELPWGLAMLGIALLLALGTWVSKVEVTSERVRIVNPWGVKSMQRSQVVDVRPGPWGVEFVTVGGRAFSALAVQCTATSRGPRPRWVDIAEAVTGRTTYWPFSRDTTGVESLDTLAEGAAAYCLERGFRITREDRDGRLVFHVKAPAKGIVELTTDGEVFTVTFPGGYRWDGFAENFDEALDVLRELLAFIDSYNDSATVEIMATRKWRPRPELRMSNGAVLRAKGWSKGPPANQE
jgi:hypothetical protein